MSKRPALVRKTKRGLHHFLALVLAVSTLSAISVVAPQVAAGSGNCVQNVTRNGTGQVDVIESGGFCFVAFKNTGAVNTQTTYTWTRPAALNSVDVLVVGGGGSGGARHGGGGGAGGFVQTDGFSISAASTVSIAVGAGGDGSTNLYGSNGQLSYFRITANGNGLTALGGGAGANSASAGNGGSGGGAGSGQTPGIAITPSTTPPQTQTNFAGTSLTGISFGSSGAAGANDTNAGVGVDNNDYWAGGGGGGAGAAGAMPTSNGTLVSALNPANTFPTGSNTTAVGGKGGDGRSVSWITPTIAAANALNIGHTVSSTVFFAGGGGGGIGVDGQAGGAGGLGGGATGTRIETTGNAGMAFTGGGGGGSGFDDINKASSTTTVNAADAGDGGSGIVVIRYQIQPAAPSITGITGGNNSLSVAFTPASDGIPVTGYRFSTNSGSTWSASTGSTSSPISITGLVNGTSYSVQIRSVSAYWDGVATSSTNALAGANCITTSSVSGGFTIVRFTSVGDCSWPIPAGVTSAEILAVGGGGGGGADGGSGGGGGALQYSSSYSLNSIQALAITVGAGGTGGSWSGGVNGGTGGSTFIRNAGSTLFEAKGGSGGLGWTVQTTIQGGTTGTGGTYTAGQNGGLGPTNCTSTANAGGTGTYTLGSSPGGSAPTNSITGSAVSYGGGGGGGSGFQTDNSGPSRIGPAGGGTSSGGRGANYKVDIDGVTAINGMSRGQNGFPNTGGGGGGGSACNAFVSAPPTAYESANGVTQRTAGGNGGSGVVILKYLNPPSISLSTSTISATIGTAVSSYEITNAGGAVASYSISPSLAVSGLSFSTSTGLISGTATAPASSTSYTVTATNASGSANATFSISAAYSNCSPTSSTSGGFTILTFSSVGICGWSVPSGVTSADVLVVGGGGGGAGTYSTGVGGSGGGGGGGGAYLANAVPLTTGQTLQIVIGNGGAGGITTSSRPGSEGSQGGDSSFGTLTAGGGGGGGCATVSTNNVVCPNSNMAGRPGTAGGSGGGASPPWNAYNWGAAGTGSSVTIGSTTYAGQTGYIGAVYNQAANSNTGGAGSGGGARSAATTSAVGSGLSTDIAGGSAVEYGRGGRGSNQSGTTFNATTSGFGNGGDGAVVTANPGSAGATGAQGVVIVKYVSTYTVTYSYNSADAGNSVASATFNLGGTAITLPTPTRTGFSFSGWYTASSGGTLVGLGGASYTPTGTIPAITLHAQWVAPSGTVSVPSAPDSITATGGNGSIQLSWAAPVSLGSRTISNYQVEYSTTGAANSWTVASSTISSTATTYTITGLTTGLSYYVRIAALFSGGRGAYGYPWQKIYGTVTPTRNGSNIDYQTGFGTTAGDAFSRFSSYTRIRYLMKATYGGNNNYVDADFVDVLQNPSSSTTPGFTFDSITNLRIPSTAVGQQFIVQGDVYDLTVLAPSTVSVQNGYGFNGRVEIWPWDYGIAPTAGVSSRSSGTYDDGDSIPGSGWYGSFQLHNLTNGSSDYRQTIFAWNNHAGTPEIGFGNNTGTHSDWTFCSTGGTCASRTNFSLEIFVNAPVFINASDATLSGLTLSSGTLSPTFASATTSYTASVTNATTSITVTPTRNQANATITVNGTAVTSGSASGSISLNVGSNTITVVVTAQDGTTTATYTVTVTRAGSSDATLSGLTLSSGTLSPTFASATTSYTASVTNAITSVTVTPTSNQANATITVNGTTVASGNASGSISLNVGSNTISVVVTAQDGTTTSTYTVTLTRAVQVFTITYAAGTGGSGTAPSSPTSVNNGATFTTPANTYTRNGFSFAGWSDGTNTYAASATYPVSGTVAGNVTLTAQWTSCGSNVVSTGLLLHLDAGNSCSTTGSTTNWIDISTNGNNAALISNPSYSSSIGGSYSFATGSAHGTLSTGFANFTSGFSISFYARFPATVGVWERIIDFGNGPTSNNIWVGRVGDTSQIGLEFWNGTNATNPLGLCASDSGAIVGNVWAHFAFTVDATNGCRIYKNGSLIKTNTGYKTLPQNISRSSNYIARSNWSGDAYFTGSIGDLALYNAALTATQVQTNYTAQAVSIAVTYDTQGGSSIASGSTVVGGAISTSPGSPTRSGYSFNGWFAASTGGSAISFPYTHSQTADFTLFAQWTQLSNVATLSALSISSGTLSPSFASGTTSYTASVANSVATGFTVTPTVTQANATTVQYLGSTGTTSFTGALSVGANVIRVLVTAQDGTTTSTYTVTVTRAAPFTITYAAGTGGSGSGPTSPSTVSDGATFTTPANTYTRTGYTFAGWSDGTNTYAASATYPVSGTVAGNVTLTATWTANTLTITYSAAGGSGTAPSTPSTVSYGSTFSTPANTYTRTGYKFAGWSNGSTVFAAGVTYPSSGTVTSNVTLTATWTALTSRTIEVDSTSYSSSYLQSSTPPTITATATAGIGTKSYSTSTSGICTIDSSTGVVTFVSTGTCSVNARIETDDTYVTATSRSASFSITTSQDGKLRSLNFSAGIISPAFSPTTYSYTVSVNSNTSSLTVTPRVFQSTSTTTVNGTTVTSGQASTSISLDMGRNTILVRGISQNGSITQTYTITVNRGVTSFAITQPTGRFLHADSIFGQTFRVPNGTSGTLTSISDIFVSFRTPFTGVVGARIYDGFAKNNLLGTSSVTCSDTDSGIAPPETSADFNWVTCEPFTFTGITLAAGTTYYFEIYRVSGASVFYLREGESDNYPDGSLYTGSAQVWLGSLFDARFAVNYVDSNSSSDSTLSGLTISSGTISPTFTSGTSSYTVAVTNATTGITVTPTRNHASATIAVNGTPVTSGSASGSIPLNVGSNTINVVVTAQDGTTTSTYTITVTRAGSNVATLSALSISSGTLSPSFASGTTSYTASVANSVATGFTVTPTVTQANATTVQYLGSTGTTSFTGALSVGANVIRVLVTAQDGTTTSTYTVTVTRAIQAFTITYAAGTGGSGSGPTSPSTVSDGATFTTPANTYTRTGYTFAGWSDGTNTYAASATYPVSGTVAGNVTLTATWNAVSCSPTSATTGGYTIYTFTSAGTCFWSVPNGITNVEILAVGGGGGGGYAWDNAGAGGGAGGQVNTGTATLSTTLEVTVGAGGSAGTTSARQGGSGGNSVVGSLTALGGGGGCAARATTCANSAQATSIAAANGGAGGAGGASGRGGGGSNTSGTVTSSTTGGAGTASSYSGASATYGVGGAGGTARGLVTSTNITGPAGSANTGNGGGGASAKSSSGDVNGGAGGSGIVIIRIPSALTVSFDSQGGSSVSDTSTVTAGVISTAPTAPTRSNYTFLGWFTATSGGSAITFPYTHGQTANFTLYAQWALNTYAITFNANNGSGTMGNQSFTHGVATNLNANLYSRANYVFHRWATNADGTGTTYNNLAQVTLTAGTTLYAQWTANTYVVAFNYNGADGGDSTSTASFTTGGSAISLPVPTKTGYTFAGWHSDAAFATAIGSAGGSGNYSPTGAVLTLNAYAKWTAINYTFTYNANSADSGSVPTETSKQISQTAIVKANTGSLVRAGYTFSGWNTASNGSGDNYLSGSIFTVQASNVILYAKWTANTYTVTYNVNSGSGSPQRGGTNVASDTYTTGGSSVVLPDVGTLTRTGYTFAGWNTSAAGTGTNYLEAATYTTVSNVIFYAKWNPVTYSITYDANSGSGAAPTTGGYTTGQASPYVVLANTFTKTSNVFGGWNTAANGLGTSYSPGASITTLTNITLYAVWIPQFTLHYAINGGTVNAGSTLPADALYNINTSVTTFSALSRAGYTFDGWTNGASTIAPGGSFAIVEDSVLTAKWTAINYTISYNSDGGTEPPANSTKQIGQSFTVASAPSKPGYNFTGWSHSSNVVGADAVVVMGSSNISYTAQWVAKVYTISYDWNGGRGTAVPDVNYTFGTAAITLPLIGDRVKDGYTFAGWSESSNGGSLLGATYTPSQSRTLYAIWNIGNFTITYNTGGGTLANTSVAVQNGGSTSLPLPTRANFVFDGWHTATVGGSSVGSNGASFTPTASQTVYARWIQASLYGITNALTRIGSVVTVANVANTFSGANSSSSVIVSVPENALPAGTTINFDMVGNSSRATGLLPNINYLISIAVSWIAGDGTVPDTASGKPILVTISNATIKAGATAYAIVNNVSTLLGTATQDGTITIALTSDPEVVVAAVKPGAPINVTASSNGNQQSVISWSPPTSTGGSAITGYTVTAAPGGGTCTTSTTSCTISSLSHGTAYTFTVTATNGVGTSAASTSAGATTAALYAVTFDAKGGTTVSSGSFLTGSTVSAPTAPSRNGYSFAGWSATDGGSAVTFPYAPGVTTAITMYARWDALDNAVTFDSKGGSDVTAGVFSSGGTVSEPTSPTRTGFTFAGWSATDGGSAVTFPYAPGVVTDITLYAKWTVVSQNNSGGGGSASILSPSEPTAPAVPAMRKVTVVAPVTIVNGQSTKHISIQINTPPTSSDFKPFEIKLDAASEKFISEFKVVDGKLVLVPETGFSGKRTITVTVTENGLDRFIQIPLTVLPEAVSKPVLTPVASNRTIIRWSPSPNASTYTVLLNGKRVCSTSTSSCSVPQALGPRALIEVVSNGGDRTVSEKIEANFQQITPILIARLVSATNTKKILSRVDTKVLDGVIALVRNQGFGTIVISEISTTSKTAPLASARIAAIKKYIDDRTGARKVTFEILPPTSRTHLNNISVKY